MRFGFFGFILGLALLMVGGSRLSESVAFTKVETPALAPFLASSRVEGWVRLSDVYLDPSAAVYIKSMSEEAAEREKNGGPAAHGTVSEVYVPARAQSAAADQSPVRLLVTSDDEKLIDLVTRVNDGDEKAMEEMSLLRDERPHVIEGMLSPVKGVDGMENSEKVNVRTDAAILTIGQTPRHWGVALIILLGGVTILSSIFYFIFLEKRFS